MGTVYSIVARQNYIAKSSNFSVHVNGSWRSVTPPAGIRITGTSDSRMAWTAAMSLFQMRGVQVERPQQGAPPRRLRDPVDRRCRQEINVPMPNRAGSWPCRSFSQPHCSSFHNRTDSGESASLARDAGNLPDREGVTVHGIRPLIPVLNLN